MYRHLSFTARRIKIPQACLLSKRNRICPRPLKEIKHIDIRCYDTKGNSSIEDEAEWSKISEEVEISDVLQESAERQSILKQRIESIQSQLSGIANIEQLYNSAKKDYEDLKQELLALERTESAKVQNF